MAISLSHVLAASGLDVLEGPPGSVAVGIDGLAALAAEKLVDRHAGALAEDVPQGHIDTADGVVEHRAVAPVGADKGRLPHVLDLRRVLAEYERLEETIDGRLHDASAAA